MKIELALLMPGHKSALAEALRDDQVWEFNSLCGEDRFERWFDKAIEKQQSGEAIVYIIKADDKVVGSSRFYEINNKHKRATIGYTVLNPSVWGQGINSDVKRQMLDKAFHELNWQRVDFHVDTINLRSCRAVEKLGAKKEGVLRHHIHLENGRVRDTVIYSILKKDC